jgi:four helix bundle protein
MRDFRELKVWERAHALTLKVYRASTGLPKEELFGLTSQMRRAAVSVEANIAEGCCRGSRADFARFLEIGMGSASELDCHLLVARDLGFALPADHEPMAREVTEVKRMLAAFIQKLRADG